jgi:glycerol-3-phosphate acyltransferase PlsY
VPILGCFIIAIGAYLLGSIPTGYLVGRAKGIDIRTAGSGNIGATNVFRSVGKTAGVFALIVDGLKGYAACTWLCDWTLTLLGVSPTDAELYRIFAGIAAVLGHNFTCWLKLSRYASIASIAAAVALPAAIWLTPHSLTLRIVTTVLGLLAIFKHRGNIRRLLNGTEHRVEFKKKEASQ